MRYSEAADLDTSSVRDVRGGGGLRGARGVAVGGGGLGLIGLLVVVLLQVLGGGAGAGAGGLSVLGQGQTTDIGRLEENCRTRADAKGGLFVDAYVVAHEYAHRVQNLLGINQQVTAGETVPDESGQPLIAEITDDDIARALDAAARIGDDFIQEDLGSGTVDQDAFTHGSSEQRQRWFRTGYETGDPSRCDTFATDDLG
ncbi:neutral zinc metallopeptidase [Blastococcus sp. SYSU DS0973]